MSSSPLYPLYSLAQDSGLILCAAPFAKEQKVDQGLDVRRSEVKGFSIRFFRLVRVSGSLVNEAEKEEGFRVRRIGRNEIEAYSPRLGKMSLVRKRAYAFKRRLLRRRLPCSS